MNTEELMRRGPFVLSTLLDLWTERAPSDGIATGFTDLDRMTGGLHRGELTVLGSRPSMGKTAFASQVAMNVAADGSRCVLYVTRQVSDMSLAVRMLGTSAQLDVHRLRTGRLDDSESDQVARCINELRKSQIVIDECASGNIESIRSVARALAERGALFLVIVDALQDFFDVAATSIEEDDRSAVVRDLKQLAKQLDCPVLALSNLNRSLERRPNKRPLPSDLRGSGVIEEGADVVLLLYRDEVYEPDSPDRGLAELSIAKQRNGPIGSIRMTFAGERLRFGEVRNFC